MVKLDDAEEIKQGISIQSYLFISVPGIKV